MTAPWLLLLNTRPKRHFYRPRRSSVLHSEILKRDTLPSYILSYSPIGNPMGGMCSVDEETKLQGGAADGGVITPFICCSDACSSQSYPRSMREKSNNPIGAGLGSVTFSPMPARPMAYTSTNSARSAASPISEESREPSPLNWA